jgi:fructose-bisphosphate aldolase class II
MKSLKEIILEADKNKTAIGHFNISDIAALKAIFKAAKGLDLPVIIGVSEGEREFIGVRQAAALVRSFREEYNYPVFLNADHTYSLDKIKEAVAAGFDAVIFDGAKFTFADNLKRTKEAVDYVKSVNPQIIVEGELGYIGSSSKILEDVPEGASINEKDLTTAGQALEFVRETGVDLFAPAVGNIHGMFRNIPNPRLNIKRIEEIRRTVNVPLVLHGGSGIIDSDFSEAVKAGISVIHINTEIRLAWREGVEKALMENKNEVSPYKILPAAEQAIYEVVLRRLKLFNKPV